MLLPSRALATNFVIAFSDFETSEDVQGTGFWRAPEILQCLEEQVQVSEIQWEAADVYSFGMTCYEILTGRSPFHDRPWSDYKVFLSGGRPELPSSIPEGLRDIIQRCWHHDRKARPTFVEIVSLLKQIDEYDELWEAGFRKAESLMLWQSSFHTPEAIFLELVRLVTDRTVDTLDSQTHRKEVVWASKFVCTAEQLVSKFGWGSYVKQPSLPFAEFVERDRLIVLMAAQFFETLLIVGHAPEEKKFILMTKLMYRAAHGFNQSKYSEQENEGLTWSDKLSIIEKAFVKPLFDVGVRRMYIFIKAKVLIKRSLSKGHRGEIGRSQLRCIFIILFLYVREFGRCAKRLFDIVVSISRSGIPVRYLFLFHFHMHSPTSTFQWI